MLSCDGLSVVCLRHTSQRLQVCDDDFPIQVKLSVDSWVRRVLDVVKTRLQVEARKGQTHYAGLRDAFVKICKQHYYHSFFFPIVS
jgi:hypothetical protein